MDGKGREIGRKGRKSKGGEEIEGREGKKGRKRKGGEKGRGRQGDQVKMYRKRKK